MAMTEHRSVSTVMGYFQAGSLLDSQASQLLSSTPLDAVPPGERTAAAPHTAQEC
ncbi:hypothetical protein GLGCALEP_03200 [Pseudomonas sp. MM221]|nr:hypothetical protein GLGCALEP_03200 [Pseudomonas sp. MM221]